METRRVPSDGRTLRPCAAESRRARGWESAASVLSLVSRRLLQASRLFCGFLFTLISLSLAGTQFAVIIFCRRTHIAQQIVVMTLVEKAHEDNKILFQRSW